MTDRQRSPLIPPLQILASAALFSSAGAAIKSSGLDGLEVAFGRSAFAAMTLLLLVRGARRAWNRSIIPVAVCYAATMLLFVSANKLTTAASTVFLQGTSPLYVLLVSPWLLREGITRRDVLLMAGFGLGLAVFMAGSEAPVDTAPRPVLGNVLAALSAVTWSGIVVGLRFLSQRPGADPDEASAAVACGNLLACLLCLPWAGGLADASGRDVLILGYLGIFQIAAAYYLLTRGVRQVPAFEASLLLLLEPVLSPIWAWSLHGERLSGMTFLGGGIILVASVAQLALRQEPLPAPRAALTPELLHAGENEPAKAPSTGRGGGPVD